MGGSGIPVYDEEGLLIFTVPYDYSAAAVEVPVFAGVSARHAESESELEVRIRSPRKYAVPILNVFAACADGLLQFKIACPPELVRHINAHEAAATYGATAQPPPDEWIELADGNPWAALQMIARELGVQVPGAVLAAWSAKSALWGGGVRP